jgi:hypothetical protein
MTSLSPTQVLTGGEGASNSEYGGGGGVGDVNGFGGGGGGVAADSFGGNSEVGGVGAGGGNEGAADSSPEFIEYEESSGSYGTIMFGLIVLVGGGIVARRFLAKDDRRSRLLQRRGKYRN